MATDGSKILAAASKKRVYSQSRVDREMARVETILRETEEVDLAEDAEHAMGNTNELPERLADFSHSFGMTGCAAFVLLVNNAG